MTLGLPALAGICLGGRGGLSDDLEHEAGGRVVSCSGRDRHLEGDVLLSVGGETPAQARGGGSGRSDPVDHLRGGIGNLRPGRVVGGLHRREGDGSARGVGKGGDIDGEGKLFSLPAGSHVEPGAGDGGGSGGEGRGNGQLIIFQTTEIELHGRG
jgi:hypothetical protein